MTETETRDDCCTAHLLLLLLSLLLLSMVCCQHGSAMRLNLGTEKT
jgi:hypothetical protein